MRDGDSEGVERKEGESGTVEGNNGEAITLEGEAFRVAPGEFQPGRNEEEHPLVVLAIGAPRDSMDVRIHVHCPDCDVRGLLLDATGTELRLTCSACDATHTPAPCPGCGGTDLRATLEGDCRPVVLCRNCGASYPTPPVEE